MIEVVREEMAVTSFDGHRVGAFLHRPPNATTPAPGLVMIPEIFGINLPLREMAARYANEGFVVLVLDVFSRLERGVDVGYDDAGHEKGRALHKAFDYAIGRERHAGRHFASSRASRMQRQGRRGRLLPRRHDGLSAASRNERSRGRATTARASISSRMKGKSHSPAADPAFRRAGSHHAARASAGADAARGSPAIRMCRPLSIPAWCMHLPTIAGPIPTTRR